MGQSPVAIVIIGRNEGERLKRCLGSLPDNVPAVYVDSGSTDGSVAYARSVGVGTFELVLQGGFTAAKARNAGWRALAANGVNARFVQFIDGDCELRGNWIEAACEALEREPGLCAVFGRRRERHPELSIYNQMCDDEWNVPVGIAASCGGDAMFRLEALQAAGGYCDDLIAGEEPDLCLRLRQKGWQIRRLDCEMTLHDAAILSISSWWRRARRSGFSYAEHVRRHGSASDPVWRRQLFSIIGWGFVLPATALAVAVMFITNRMAAITVGITLIAAYAVQALRIARRKLDQGASSRFAIQYGALTVAGKVAEVGGVWRCWTTQLLRKRPELIEYKSSS